MIKPKKEYVKGYGEIEVIGLDEIEEGLEKIEDDKDLKKYKLIGEAAGMNLSHCFYLACKYADIKKLKAYRIMKHIKNTKKNKGGPMTKREYAEVEFYGLK